MKSTITAALLVILAVLNPHSVQAQSYPSHPIRLIVPFPPGGGTDLISRELALALNQTAGMSLVAENRPGAGGNLGVDAAAKSAPDGYTIVMGQTSNLAINPTLYKKIPYNPFKDLTPVALIASSPLVLVVPASSPYRSLAEMISDAQTKPGTLNVASPGNGTVAHLAAERLQQVAGFKAQHIPYKGFNLAFNDLVAGQVQLFMSSVPTTLGQIRAGKLRALAVSSLVRSEELPEVPTIAESGYPGFTATTWFGLMVPAGTSPEIVQRLNHAVNQAIQQQSFRQKLKNEGAVVLGGSPGQMADLLKRDFDLWSSVVKTSGATID